MNGDLGREYVLLFRALSDAIADLKKLRRELMEAQQKAEELYISRDESI